MESHIKATECLCRMHELIKRECTGSPDDFAERLDISRRQLYRILAHLRDRGALIKFDRTRRTFYYTSNFEITVTKLHLLSYSTNGEKRE